MKIIGFLIVKVKKTPREREIPFVLDENLSTYIKEMSQKGMGQELGSVT